MPLEARESPETPRCLEKWSCATRRGEDGNQRLNFQEMSATSKKRKIPLIDLCVYSEACANEFIRTTPKLAGCARLVDNRGWHHFLLRCGDAPFEESPIKNQQGETIGYWKPACAEMRLIAESMGKNPECN